MNDIILSLIMIFILALVFWCKQHYEIKDAEAVRFVPVEVPIVFPEGRREPVKIEIKYPKEGVIGWYDYDNPEWRE